MNDPYGGAHIAPGLALRLRRALGNAAPGGSLIRTSAWQAERDTLADLFETVEPTPLSERDARRVIDLLAESTPSVSSRLAASAWDDEVSALVSELLSARG